MSETNNVFSPQSDLKIKHMRDYDAGVGAGMVMEDMETGTCYWFKLVDAKEKNYNVYSITEDEIKLVIEDIDNIESATENGLIYHKYTPKPENMLCISQL